jgi:hypothetical protein
MGVWNAEDNDLDRGLVNSGFVTKFFRDDILDETIEWLDDHGYAIAEVDALDWFLETDIHEDLAVALDFPDHYGRNLDALLDCFRDVADRAYGWDADDAGIILVIRNFDTYFDRDRRTPLLLLDIFTEAAIRGALIGNRMMCLIGSKDPGLDIGPVGAQNVAWNSREWMTSTRFS